MTANFKVSNNSAFKKPIFRDDQSVAPKTTSVHDSNYNEKLMNDVVGNVSDQQVRNQNEPISMTNSSATIMEQATRNKLLCLI